MFKKIFILLFGIICFAFGTSVSYAFANSNQLNVTKDFNIINSNKLKTNPSIVKNNLTTIQELKTVLQHENNINNRLDYFNSQLQTSIKSGNLNQEQANLIYDYLKEQDMNFLDNSYEYIYNHCWQMYNWSHSNNDYYGHHNQNEYYSGNNNYNNGYRSNHNRGHH